MAEENPNKAPGGGAPKTWQKTTRLNPHQQFRMYNPLKMEYTKHAKLARKEIGFSFQSKNHHAMVRMEANRIKQQKRALSNNIQRAMHDKGG